MFIAMKKLTFILLIALMVTGCSNSLPKTPELPKMPKLSMPELPKMPKLSLPSWAKPKMPSIDVYKPTIMQGSVLDMSEVNKLQLGMSKLIVNNLSCQRGYKLLFKNLSFDKLSSPLLSISVKRLSLKINLKRYCISISPSIEE